MNDADPNATALAYYAAWGARQHSIPGGAAAPAAQAFAQLWRAVFLVPYVQGGSSDNFLVSRGKEGRLRYCRGALVTAAPSSAQVGCPTNAALGAAPIIIKNGTVPASVLASAKACVSQLGGLGVPATLQGLLANATALAAQIPAARLGFYTSHTLLQVSLHAGGSAGVANTYLALDAASAGNMSGARAYTAAAVTAFESVLSALRAGQLPA